MILNNFFSEKAPSSGYTHEQRQLLYGKRDKTGRIGTAGASSRKHSFTGSTTNPLGDEVRNGKRTLALALSQGNSQKNLDTSHVIPHRSDLLEIDEMIHTYLNARNTTIQAAISPSSLSKNTKNINYYAPTQAVCVEGGNNKNDCVDETKKSQQDLNHKNHNLPIGGSQKFYISRRDSSGLRCSSLHRQSSEQQQPIEFEDSVSLRQFKGKRFTQPDSGMGASTLASLSSSIKLQGQIGQPSTPNYTQGTIVSNNKQSSNMFRRLLKQRPVTAEHAAATNGSYNIGSRQKQGIVLSSQANDEEIKNIKQNPYFVTPQQLDVSKEATKKALTTLGSTGVRNAATLEQQRQLSMDKENRRPNVRGVIGSGNSEQAKENNNKNREISSTGCSMTMKECEELLDRVPNKNNGMQAQMFKTDGFGRRSFSMKGTNAAEDRAARQSDKGMILRGNDETVDPKLLQQNLNQASVTGASLSVVAKREISTAGQTGDKRTQSMPRSSSILKSKKSQDNNMTINNNISNNGNLPLNGNLNTGTNNGAVAKQIMGLNRPGTAGVSGESQKESSSIAQIARQQLQQMERYEMRQAIGKGSYAVVKLAKDTQNNALVAIKMYDKYKLADPQKRNNVKREISILSRLNHRNVIKLVETIETRISTNLVMEYISSLSLRQFMKSLDGRKLDEKHAKKIFSQLVSAVAYCHEKEVVHRDIKLENIMVDAAEKDQCIVKLIDFGFAIRVPSMKRLNVFCGTPTYMSPEITKKTEYFGKPADVWSLGVVLFALLCGRFPFKGNDDAELFKKIQSGDFRISSCVSGAGEKLINKLLRQNPVERPSAKEVLFDPWFMF